MRNTIIHANVMYAINTVHCTMYIVQCTSYTPTDIILLNSITICVGIQNGLYHCGIVHYTIPVLVEAVSTLRSVCIRKSLHATQQ